MYLDETEELYGMPFQSTNDLPIEATKDKYNRVMCLAKERNKKALTHLFNSGVNLNFIFGSDSVLTALAKEGCDWAVNLFIEKFQYNLDDALLGYAIRYDLANVVKLIKAGADPNMTILGYAIAGRSNEVFQLIKTVRQFMYAARGFALVDILLFSKERGFQFKQFSLPD